MADEKPVTPDVPEPTEDGPPGELPDEALPDFTDLQDDYEQRLGVMLDGWDERAAPLIDSIVDQVDLAAASGDLLALQGLSLVTYDLAAWAQDASTQAAMTAAEIASAEAEDQGVEVPPGHPDTHLLASVAQLSAATLGAGLILSATRQAMRWWTRRRAGAVSSEVRRHLESLTMAQPKYVLGGMLTGAQREGRWATARGGPGAALYSSEVLDHATCKYCRAVHGRWLGNTDDPAEPWLKTYPTRGYVDCLGEDRCRGQIVYVWRGGDDWKKWVEKEPWR
jgi:hypothetical protein